MNSNTNSHQIARNAVASYITLAAQVISGLAVTPLLFRSLGASGFGTYALAVNLVSYAGLFELGVGTATLRLIAVSAAGSGEVKVREVLGSSRALYVPITLMSALALCVIVFFAPELPGATGTTVTEVRATISALGAGQLFSVLMNVYPAYIYGTGRADVLYTFGAVSSLVLSAAQVFVALADGGVVVLALATATVSLLSALIIAVVARRMLGSGRARLRDSTKRTRQKLLSFGLRNAGVSVLATLSQQSDIVIVGAFFSAPRVAAYAVAVRAANFAKSVATRAADVLVPTFADAAARKDEGRQFSIFVEASVLTSAVLVPAALTVLLFGRRLLELWLGSVPDGAYPVLVLLVIAAAVQAVGHVGFVFFNGRGELDLFLRLGSFVAFGNVLLSVLLTSILGLIGPAIGTLVAIAVFDLLVVPRKVAQKLRRNPRELFSVLARILAAPLLISGAAGLLMRLTLGSAPSATVAASALTLIVFYMAWLASVGGTRRRRYRRLLRGQGVAG